MENRTLQEQLSNATMDNALVKRLANSIGEDLRIELARNYNHQAAEAQVRLDPTKKALEIRFSLCSDSSLFIHISDNAITYGFSFEVNTNHLCLETSKGLSSIRNRYFSRLQIEPLHSIDKILSSRHSIDSKMLGSRNFIEYSVFLLDKAALMVNDLAASNKIVNKHEAAA